jgi:hypothetical protein
MPAEIKSHGAKVETQTSTSFRTRYKKHCAKKLKISVAQRLRDLMQLDIKGKLNG